MRIRHLLLTALFLALTATGASAEKRVALVIGNSSYQNVPKLTNPSNDAAMIASTLKASGFESVTLRADVTKDTMRKALRDFADQARDADIAVVYYAGHGIEVDGTNFLIPVDAVLERDTDVYDETYPLDRVLVAMEPAKQLRLIILDACRDNPFGKTMKRSIGTRAIGTRGLAKVEPVNPNTMIAFAAKAGSTAADGDGKNSPFAKALAAHIATPGMDLRKSFGFVRDDVLKITNNQQEPFIYGSLGGNDVALVPGPVVAATPPVSGAPVQQFAPVDSTDRIRRDYELALQVGTKDAWDYFIANYPEGFYSDLARAQSKKLAALAPQQGTSRTTAPGDDNLPRQLLTELRRVGCYADDPVPTWNAGAQRSLDLFNKYAGTRFDVKIASLDALEVIKGRTGRICPLVCKHGYQVDGDNCTKITCKDGYEVGDDNTCERIVVRKPPPPKYVPPVASRPDRDTPPRRAAQDAPSGQLFCPGGVCRPVARGCHVVNDTTTNGGIMNGGALVCN
ncbi:MAG: caspase family protein [Afipia sp.]|nr:caspase family protein [Afipia sp.]